MEQTERMPYLQQIEVPAPVLLVRSNERSINETERNENKEYAHHHDDPSFCFPFRFSSVPVSSFAFFALSVTFTLRWRSNQVTWKHKTHRCMRDGCIGPILKEISAYRNVR